MARQTCTNRLAYQKLKNTNESLAKTLESQQESLDSLETRRKTLEEEIASSHVKQEAVRLHEQIHALEDKRDNLLNEIRNKETPQVRMVVSFFSVMVAHAAKHELKFWEHFAQKTNLHITVHLSQLKTKYLINKANTYKSRAGQK